MKKKRKKTRGTREGQNGPSQPSRRRQAAPTARDRQVLEAVRIDEPSAGLRGDTVRVVDTIGLLYRRGQIDDRQRQAADMYRHAADVCAGGIPCALAPRAAGRARGQHSPTEAQLGAAGILSEAARILGQLDARILTLVAVEGYSIEQATGRLFGVGAGGRAKRGDAEHVGRRLRLALDALAEAWWPARGRSPVAWLEARA